MNPSLQFYLPQTTRNSMSKAETKDALKEALKEWLDEKFTDLGRWSLRAIAAAALTALTYFILKLNGWTKP